MKITFERMLTTFDFWNETIFVGDLITPDFLILSDDKISGYFMQQTGEPTPLYAYVEDVGEYQILAMNRDLICTWRVFHATMLHEMIHVCQAQNGYTMGHGRDFKTWARMIHQTTGHKM